MALASALVPLGTPAPDFALEDLTGQTWTLAAVREHPVLVVVFACNHCPYVQHIEDRLGAVARTSPAGFLAICSNDADAYPDDAPRELAEQAERAGWRFPYLLDQEQMIARRFDAVCTPDFFVYGPDRRLAYRGAFDESTPKNGVAVTGTLLTDAIHRISRGEAVPEPHRASMGCGIKWKPGQDAS